MFNVLMELNMPYPLLLAFISFVMKLKQCKRGYVDGHRHWKVFDSGFSWYEQIVPQADRVLVRLEKLADVSYQFIDVIPYVFLWELNPEST